MKARGLTLAKITNIKDPENRNRVKCQPISADKDVSETDWCYCIAPMAGKNYGMHCHPQVGDSVLLGYLGDDVHHPIVIGSYWAEQADATYPVKDGVNEIRSIKTPSGIEIKLDDEKDKQKLSITVPSGTLVSLDDEKKTISVQDKKAENKLIINWEKGEITLAAKTKLTLSAGDTSLTLESSGNMEGKASKAVKLTGADVAIKGNSSVKADGASVELKASGMLKAQASGNAVIKGAMVQIN